MNDLTPQELAQIEARKAQVAKMIEANKLIIAENGLKNLNDINAYVLKARKVVA